MVCLRPNAFALSALAANIIAHRARSTPRLPRRWEPRCIKPTSLRTRCRRARSRPVWSRAARPLAQSSSAFHLLRTLVIFIGGCARLFFLTSPPPILLSKPNSGSTVYGYVLTRTRPDPNEKTPHPRTPQHPNPNRETFKAHHVSPRQPPPKVVASDGGAPAAKFDGTTSYTADFVPHAVAPRSPPPPAPRPSPSENARFDGTTSHTADYVPHAVAPRVLPPKAPQTSPGGGARFDGTTSYSATFVPHAVSPRQPPPRVGASGAPPSDVKFECVFALRRARAR